MLVTFAHHNAQRSPTNLANCAVSNGSVELEDHNEFESKRTTVTFQVIYNHPDLKSAPPALTKALFNVRERPNKIQTDQKSTQVLLASPNPSIFITISQPLEICRPTQTSVTPFCRENLLPEASLLKLPVLLSKIPTQFFHQNSSVKFSLPYN